SWAPPSTPPLPPTRPPNKPPLVPPSATPPSKPPLPPRTPPSRPPCWPPPVTPSPLVSATTVLVALFSVLPNGLVLPGVCWTTPPALLIVAPRLATTLFRPSG